MDARLSRRAVRARSLASTLATRPREGSTGLPPPRSMATRARVRVCAGKDRRVSEFSPSPPTPVPAFGTPVPAFGIHPVPQVHQRCTHPPCPRRQRRLDFLTFVHGFEESKRALRIVERIDAPTTGSGICSNVELYGYSVLSGGRKVLALDSAQDEYHHASGLGSRSSLGDLPNLREYSRENCAELS